MKTRLLTYLVFTCLGSFSYSYAQIQSPLTNTALISQHDEILEEKCSSNKNSDFRNKYYGVVDLHVVGKHNVGIINYPLAGDVKLNFDKYYYTGFLKSDIAEIKLEGCIINGVEYSGTAVVNNIINARSFITYIDKLFGAVNFRMDNQMHAIEFYSIGN